MCCSCPCPPPPCLRRRLSTKNDDSASSGQLRHVRAASAASGAGEPGCPPLPPPHCNDFLAFYKVDSEGAAQAQAGVCLGSTTRGGSGAEEAERRVGGRSSFPPLFQPCSGHSCGNALKTICRWSCAAASQSFPKTHFNGDKHPPLLHQAQTDASFQSDLRQIGVFLQNLFFFFFS